MIFLGLGANLPSETYGAPRATCEAALAVLEKRDIRVIRRSRWWLSAPVPAGPDPWFVNGVAEIESSLDPDAVLAALHAVEAEAGRVRGRRNAPRPLDLDLLAWHGLVRTSGSGAILPHPRMAERAFVLLPLAELEPGWVHPATGVPVGRLIAALPPGQDCRPMDGDGGKS